MANEFDIPVFVHINRGPPPNSPSRPAGCCPEFDASLGNPESLRLVLEEYPDLRLVLQHAGFPALDMLGGIDYLGETFALLGDFSTVYVDMTALNAAVPEPLHAAAVQLFIERGFGDRIMFGTDNWEAAPIVERYQNFSFLTEEQRTDIFYGNAARFLRLAEE
ncbi:MAG: amidohydrolase family protein [Pseudomonadota bacterium]